MAKKQKTAFEEKAYKAFAGMTIDKWLDFIKANAKDADETRQYKLIARRSLNIDNMKAYIEANDNTKAAKKALIQLSPVCRLNAMLLLATLFISGISTESPTAGV